MRRTPALLCELAPLYQWTDEPLEYCLPINSTSVFGFDVLHFPFHPQNLKLPND